LVPQAEKTLRIYEGMMRDRNCGLIHIIVPEVDQDILDKLGFGGNENDISDEGIVSKIAMRGLSRTGFLTPNTSGGDWAVCKMLRSRFAKYFGQDANQDSPQPEKVPLLFGAYAHGGNRDLDTPMPMYAAEVALQGWGIPYRVLYEIGNEAMALEVKGKKTKQIAVKKLSKSSRQ
jgi:hypothetical protein